LIPPGTNKQHRIIRPGPASGATAKGL
jgi:hypothetical protein